jgi:hypothetical protein
VGNGEEISGARIKVYCLKKKFVGIFLSTKLTSAFRINFKETF